MTSATYPLNSIERCYDPPLRRFILLLTLPLLFLPKINLLKMQGESAGLRVDDLFLLIVSVLIVFGILYSRRPLLKVERLFISFLAVAGLSLLCNWVLFYVGTLSVRANPLYVMRLAEYFVFFYVGALCLRFINRFTLLKFVLLVNCVLAVLQLLGLVGGFTIYGYEVNREPIGLTAGHWELGLILSILYAFFLFEDTKESGLSSCDVRVDRWRVHTSRPLFIAFIFLMALLIGGRSGALGIVVVTGLWLLQRQRRRLLLPILLAIALIGTALASFVDFSTFTLMQRSTQLLQWKNATAFITLFDQVSIDQPLDDVYNAMNVDEPGIDVSWHYRVYKWSYIVKSYLTHPNAYLLGLGPGYFGMAVDGGLLRLVTEYGIVGAGLYLAMLLQASKGSPALRACLIAFLCNMLFLDSFLAYKGMSLYYFLMYRPIESDLS